MGPVRYLDKAWQITDRDWPRSGRSGLFVWRQRAGRGREESGAAWKSGERWRRLVWLRMGYGPVWNVMAMGPGSAESDSGVGYDHLVETRGAKYPAARAWRLHRCGWGGEIARADDLSDAGGFPGTSGN